MEKYPQVMTIVKNSPEEKPLIISSNISEGTDFRQNEVTFLKEVYTYLENESNKQLQKNAAKFWNSL